MSAIQDRLLELSGVQDAWNHEDLNHTNDRNRTWVHEELNQSDFNGQFDHPRKTLPSSALDSPVSGGEDEALRFLTDQSLISRGPLVFILVLMLMIGGTVNLVVTAVFFKRFPPSALRSYVMTMSVSDLVATSMGIPLHIHTVLNSYNYQHPVVCNVFFAVTSLSTNMSSFIVVLFAVDRLRRVRKPVFKELDTFRSYKQVAVVVTLACVVTVPFIPMYGIYTEPTFAGHAVRMCWVDDAYRDSIYPLVYKGVLGLTFCVSLVLMVFCYSTIGYHVYVLSEDTKADVLYSLSHPPPPNKFMYIYSDDISGAQGRKLSELRAKLASIAEVDKPGGSASVLSGRISSHASLRRIPLSFVERLHAPRPHGHLAEEEAGDRQTFSQRSSRIKKISSAIQNFFAPIDSESTSGSNNSSFISVRANCSFVRSFDTAKPVSSKEMPQQKPAEPPPMEWPKDMSDGSAFIQDTSISTTSSDYESTRTSIERFSKQENENRSAAGPPPDDRQQSVTRTRKSNMETVLPEAHDGGAGSTSATPAGRGEGAGPSSVKTEGRGGETRLQSLYVTTDSMVTKPHTTTEYANVVNKGEWKRELLPKPSPEQLKDPPQTRISNHGSKQMGLEALATLDHLEKIKKNCRNTMATLIILYVLTWLPNLFFRLFVSKPPNLCNRLSDCWTNGQSYASCSVFINSTVNAFFYCFGSVHFRKQVRLFFQPCKNKLCPKRKRKKNMRMVKKKKVKEVVINVPQTQSEPEPKPETEPGAEPKPGQEPDDQEAKQNVSSPTEELASPVDQGPPQPDPVKVMKGTSDPDTTKTKKGEQHDKPATSQAKDGKTI